MELRARLSKVFRQKTQIKITFTADLNESDIEFESFEGFSGFLKFVGKPITKQIEDAMNDRHYAVETDKKTPSQILRGRILELWSVEDPEGAASPEQFYLSKMDQVTNWITKRTEEIRDAKPK